ncbi:hypothetical protein BaRGS_00014569 [Batillaria attramentaria]|uniref:Uncharacterized protein n=1 Tax=Batillaria attramentaria TaxID=370345 RepID=A0ABD0L3K1_9CAEN
MQKKAIFTQCIEDSGYKKGISTQCKTSSHLVSIQSNDTARAKIAQSTPIVLLGHVLRMHVTHTTSTQSRAMTNENNLHQAPKTPSSSQNMSCVSEGHRPGRPNDSIL